LLWPIDINLGACNQNNGIIFSSLPSFITYSCHINTWLNRWKPGFVALRRFLSYLCFSTNGKNKNSKLKFIYFFSTFRKKYGRRSRKSENKKEVAKVSNAGWPVGPTFPTFSCFLIQSPTFPYFLGKQPYYPHFLGCHVVKLNKEHLKHVFLHWYST